MAATEGGSSVNINLHIDRLVIDDRLVAAHNKTEFKTAVATELGQLLSNQSINSASQLSSPTRALDGGTICVACKQSPSHVGQQVAGAVMNSITPTTKSGINK